MIFIERGMEPDILKTQGKTQASALCAAYDRDADGYSKGEWDFKFDPDIYGHSTVKASLKAMQHGKCCFCESKIMHITFGDVEHYRPKAGYKQTAREKKLNKPGYYWLAYDWNNLLLCCERCNRRHKRNLFPLKDKQARAHNHQHDVSQEIPLFINPTVTDPRHHIGFREEIPYPIAQSRYGKTTITELSLDREDLNEQRRTKLEELKVLADVVSLSKAQPNNPELRDLSAQAQKVLAQATLPSAEYSLMATSLRL